LFLDEIGNLSLPLQSKLLTVLQQRKVQKVGSSKEIPVNFRLICATNMQLHEMVYEKSFRQDLLYRINTVEIRVPALRERSDDIPLLLEFFLKRYAAKYKRQDIRIEKSVITRLKRYHWPGNIRELQHAVERAVILTDSRVIHSADLFLNTTPTPVRSEQKPVTLEEMERKFIEQSLAEHGGNVSNTARALGMTRTALYRRMKKHGIG
jgi:DNA-binding NtrC family response regulator